MTDWTEKFKSNLLEVVARAEKLGREHGIDVTEYKSSLEGNFEPEAYTEISDEALLEDIEMFDED